ncbi:hypothetical protein BLA29_015494 [Euroglyphus maynei]|uniref:Uncharacterized protein n=1 Tax=Euroglyphus maynei TaxID=6958 RepID=A0A1Y3B6T2_EURMA|nr:hypothetical protein BLA29_015494 [Euroglyphus maynei]
MGAEGLGGAQRRIQTGLIERRPQARFRAHGASLLAGCRCCNAAISA